jgi:hypothetical protein
MKHPLCVLRRHRWSLEADAEGPYQRCSRCGKVKRAGDGHRPTIHRDYGGGSGGWGG